MDLEKIYAISLFSEVKKSDLENFLTNTSNMVRHFHIGDMVAIQNDICDFVLFLIEGVVRTSMTNNVGKEIVIENIDAPKILAPAFIYGSNNRFPVSVEAVVECEVLILNKIDFLKFMQKETSVLVKFLQIISDRSIFLTQKVNAFALQNLKSRLAQYLLGANIAETQQQIADKLGVARPSIARILSDFIVDGCISVEKRNIKILDNAKLQKYV